MENRLTFPKGSKDFKVWTRDEMVEMLIKLQAYEDTGLSPEEVKALKDRVRELEEELLKYNN